MSESQQKGDVVQVLGMWRANGALDLGALVLDLPPHCKITCQLAGTERRKKVGTVELFTFKLEYVCLTCNFTAHRKAEFDGHKCPRKVMT